MFQQCPSPLRRGSSGGNLTKIHHKAKPSHEGCASFHCLKSPDEFTTAFRCANISPDYHLKHLKQSNYLSTSPFHLVTCDNTNFAGFFCAGTAVQNTSLNLKNACWRFFGESHGPPGVRSYKHEYYRGSPVSKTLDTGLPRR